MRKLSCLFLVLCIITAGCVPIEERSDEASPVIEEEVLQETSSPIIFEIQIPLYGVNGDYNLWFYSSETAQGSYSTGDVLTREEPKTIAVVLNQHSDGICTVAGDEYRVIPSGDPEGAYFKYYEWIFDRSFFQLYGESKTGYKIYKIDRDETLEVLIIEKDGTEMLVAKSDSPILDPSSYSADDFGLCLFGCSYIARTLDFEWLIAAHANGENAEPFEGEINQPSPTSIKTVMLESTKYPGLRYVFHVVDDIDGNWYVFSREDNSMVRLLENGDELNFMLNSLEI